MCCFMGWQVCSRKDSNLGPNSQRGAGQVGSESITIAPPPPPPHAWKPPTTPPTRSRSPAWNSIHTPTSHHTPHNTTHTQTHTHTYTHIHTHTHTYIHTHTHTHTARYVGSSGAPTAPTPAAWSASTTPCVWRPWRRLCWRRESRSACQSRCAPGVWVVGCGNVRCVWRVGGSVGVCVMYVCVGEHQGEKYAVCGFVC